MAIQNSFTPGKMQEIYNRNPTWAPAGYQSPQSGASQPTAKPLSTEQRTAAFSPNQLAASQNRLGITPTAPQAPAQQPRSTSYQNNDPGYRSMQEHDALMSRMTQDSINRMSQRSGYTGNQQQSSTGDISQALSRLLGAGWGDSSPAPGTVGGSAATNQNSGGGMYTNSPGGPTPFNPKDAVSMYGQPNLITDNRYTGNVTRPDGTYGPQQQNPQQTGLSQQQLEAVYNRHPEWMSSANQQQAGQTQGQQATPNSAQVTGGIDFSNIKPQFSISGSTGTSANNSQSGLSQMGNNALAPLLGTGQGSMPSLIDDWTNNVMSKLTVSQNDIMDQINQAANIQAQKGIMGGTEANNLRATMLRQLIQPTLQQQAQTLTSGLAAKAQAMPNLIGLTQQSGSTGSANNNSMSYGQSPQDYQIIADMIRSGWTG